MTNRFEKTDWLIENCTPNFITECSFLLELVAWIDEDTFDKFHEHVCRNWDIKSPFIEQD